MRNIQLETSPQNSAEKHKLFEMGYTTVIEIIPIKTKVSTDDKRMINVN